MSDRREVRYRPDNSDDSIEVYWIEYDGRMAGNPVLVAKRDTDQYINLALYGNYLDDLITILQYANMKFKETHPYHG